MKFARPLVFLLAALAGLIPAGAQAPATPVIHHITSQQAVDMALKRRTEMLNARLDIDNQEALNREITGRALPQITGTVSLSKLFNIPVTVLPDFISPSVYGVLEREGVRDGNGDPIKWDGVINTFPAQFGVPWQANLGVSVQQLLFQPDVFIGLKARSTALDLYEKQLKVAEDSVKSNVLNTYIGVLVAEKGLQYAAESQSRLQQLLKEQTEMFRNGFIEKLDLDKTQVSLNNVSTTVTQLRNMVAVSYAGLKFALAIPQTDSLHLVDSLSAEWITKDLLEAGGNFDYNQRAEIQALQASERLLELQVRQFRLQALPTIAAQWNLATAAQRQKFDFFARGERYFFSNVLGVSMSIPLVDGWQRHNRVKQAQYALEKNRNTMDQFRQVIDLQVINARNSLVNAIEAYRNQEENKALAEKVFQTTKIKYQQGLGSSFEVLQAETDLQNALNNYYQALYNAGVARVAYLRALGKL